MGEIFFWYVQWLVDGSGIHNTIAQRIVDAKKAYGHPTWVDVGNWGWARNDWHYPHWTPDLINFFHTNGIKCCCQIPVDSDYGTNTIPWADIKAEIDYQMSLCPDIDGFFFDSCYHFSAASDANNCYAVLATIRDYVHNLGAAHGRSITVFMNCGSFNVSADMLSYADVWCFESSWLGVQSTHPELFTAANIAAHKFMGLENNHDPITISQHGTVTLDSAISDTKLGWNTGIWYMNMLDDAGAIDVTIPAWWEQYLAAIATPPPSGIDFTFSHGYQQGTAVTLNLT